MPKMSMYHSLRTCSQNHRNLSETQNASTRVPDLQKYQCFPIEFSHKLNCWKVFEIWKVMMMIFQGEDNL